jgi:hypothetical protein
MRRGGHEETREFEAARRGRRSAPGCEGRRLGAAPRAGASSTGVVEDGRAIARRRSGILRASLDQSFVTLVKPTPVVVGSAVTGGGCERVAWFRGEGGRSGAFSAPGASCPDEEAIRRDWKCSGLLAEFRKQVPLDLTTGAMPLE